MEGHPHNLFKFYSSLFPFYSRQMEVKVYSFTVVRVEKTHSFWKQELWTTESGNDEQIQGVSSEIL